MGAVRVLRSLRDERGLFSPAQKRLKGDLQRRAAVRAFTEVTVKIFLQWQMTKQEEAAATGCILAGSDWAQEGKKVIPQECGAALGQIPREVHVLHHYSILHVGGNPL